ncbi:MAG: alpha/beta hydrolase, partial [Gammaproteobacteria bacterium]
MPSARNGSIVVHYDVRGTGPAAILFNHSGTSSLAWSERFLEAMAEHLGVVTVDHRGTGQSSAVSGGPLSMAELASDALAVLEQEGIESAVVIGTSMGGAVAQEFALAYPRYVSTLVLLGTFAGNAQLVPPEPAVVDVMREASGTKSTIARWRRILSVTYSAKFLAQHEDVALELELKGARFTTDETIASHADAVSRFEAYDRLPAISASTLVVHGT